MKNSPFLLLAVMVAGLCLPLFAAEAPQEKNITCAVLQEEAAAPLVFKTNDGVFSCVVFFQD